MDTISCVWIEIPGELPVTGYFNYSNIISIMNMVGEVVR